MTMTATACGLSFHEVDVEVVEEVVVEQWEPKGEGMVPLQGALSTGLMSQVGNLFLWQHFLVISLSLFILKFLFSQSLSKLLIPGLPPSGSWQDLKDHMREAGDVCYADVFRDGTGVVEFVRKEDMTYAVRKLDNTKFRSHEVGQGHSLRLTQQGIDLGLDFGIEKVS